MSWCLMFVSSNLNMQTMSKLRKDTENRKFFSVFNWLLSPSINKVDIYLVLSTGLWWKLAILKSLKADISNVSPLYSATDAASVSLETYHLDTYIHAYYNNKNFITLAYIDKSSFLNIYLPFPSLPFPSLPFPSPPLPSPPNNNPTTIMFESLYLAFLSRGVRFPR